MPLLLDSIIPGSGILPHPRHESRICRYNQPMTELADTLAGPMWEEDESQVFLRYGPLFVPRREEQIETVCRLIPADLEDEFNAVELGAGDGALASAVMSSFPNCLYLALDGSELLRARLQASGKSNEGRLQVVPFELADREWRTRLPSPLRCVLASLIVHHLNSDGKRQLFSDIASRLEPGGAVIMIDLVEPTSSQARDAYARQWDDDVRARVQASGEGPEAYHIFRNDRWNFYADPTPDPYDQPSPLADQLNWLRYAGFSRVDCFWMYAGHAIFGGYK